MTNDTNDHFAWLTRWYAAQCDGDWEHTYGVVIETIDNPGWLLKIDLTDTDLEEKSFETVAVNTGAPDGDPSASWYHCKIEDGHFQASGGAHDLSTLIGIFRRWVEGDHA